MHSIEPYYNWKHFYSAEEDENSPFYKREYSEFYFTNTIYDYYIHPQWDDMGSSTLYLKILYVDYDNGYAIMEFIGEWNDCISNDVMYLKRDVVDPMLECGINKFILIGENILNFHFDGDDYYDEWFQDVEDGWIAAVNFQEHVLREFREHNIDYYLNFGGELDVLSWRTQEPSDLYNKIETVMNRRLIAGS
jgi:hypothetical protein